MASEEHTRTPSESLPFGAMERPDEGAAAASGKTRPRRKTKRTRRGASSDAGGAGQWISNNHIQVMYGNQYHAKGHCTGLQLGDPDSRKIVHNEALLPTDGQICADGRVEAAGRGGSGMTWPSGYQPDVLDLPLC